MIIPVITSGLGNQLFQYALAKQLSVLNNTQLYFDLRFYQTEYARETQRTFKLDKFNIQYSELNRPLEYGIKLTRAFPNRNVPLLFSYVREKHFHFDPDILELRSPCIFLMGYWQSEKYFHQAADQVRKELSFKNEPCEVFFRIKEQIINANNPVSLHIRRGDYVHHPVFSETFGFIGTDYYRMAISRMNSMVGECDFFIFTDDREWVEKEFPLPGNATYVTCTGPDADIDDLHLMTLCNHHIIANSSYSWWGAWLGNNADKCVIAPKHWYKNQPDWDIKDLVPDGWEQI
ncbi:alpha-1,2-fucosyltransferase [Pararcticibacter amylolyticus]|uniref:Alpha-1,2-fucosyltransferase n=1 Tax=Pararcticibacter amylolyticus TaxID=2173175 RepID=A0A2U2PL95_9SPHI|nr:alpha-1,2-fucosyltransferase [Pararcticibacter amylolyticus]PWG82177.1 alpha-1,2-fucosyltransferase [Pararcticibacter amylolyticus]